MKLKSFIFGTLNKRQQKKGRRVSLFHRQTGHHETAPAQSEGHVKERRSISVFWAQIKLWGEGFSSWVAVPLRTVLVSDSYVTVSAPVFLATKCSSSIVQLNKKKHYTVTHLFVKGWFTKKWIFCHHLLTLFFPKKKTMDWSIKWNSDGPMLF